MVDIKSDNPEVEKCLKAIVEKTIAYGGTYKSPMTIACENGNLSILAPQEQHTGNLISLPSAVLPPIAKFNLKLKENDLYIDSHDDDLSEASIEMMKMMMELYNLTEKIKEYKKTSPCFFIPRHKELSDLILQGRNGPEIKNKLNTSDTDDSAVISSYLLSRVLGFKFVEDNNEKRQVLMPIIDCINHHVSGTPYNNTEGHLAVKAINAIPGHEEIFTYYGPYDAIDTIISYAYADESAPFMRSVPVTVDMGATGKLVINSFTTTQPSGIKLPEQLKDLWFFFPNQVSKTPDRFEISHLYIPGRNAPRALRRVLGALIPSINPGLLPEQIIDHVKQAEEQIIQQNTDYYEKIQKALTALPANEQSHFTVKELRKAVAVQKEKLDIYDDIRQSFGV